MQVKTYLAELDCENLAPETWSQELPLLKVIQRLDENYENMRRLKPARLAIILKSLAKVHLYLRVTQSGRPTISKFSIPLSESDESPGVEAIVKIGYFPDGFVGKSDPPPAALGNESPSNNNEIKINQANFGRLRKHLLKLRSLCQAMVSTTGSLVDTLDGIDIAEPDDQGLDESDFPTFARNVQESIQSLESDGRNLGRLSRLFDDEDDAISGDINNNDGQFEALTEEERTKG